MAISLVLQILQKIQNLSRRSTFLQIRNILPDALPGVLAGLPGAGAGLPRRGAGLPPHRALQVLRAAQAGGPHRAHHPQLGAPAAGLAQGVEAEQVITDRPAAPAQTAAPPRPHLVLLIALHPRVEVAAPARPPLLLLGQGPQPGLLLLV